MNKPAPGTRAQYASFHQIPTRWLDNDQYGHMNNAVHYTLFDTAVNEWLIRNEVTNPGQGDTIGLIVENGCRYFSQMGFPDIVTVGIRIAKLGSSSVRYELGLFQNDNDTAAAEGFFIHVYVDAETHAPKPLDPRRREILGALLVD